MTQSQREWHAVIVLWAVGVLVLLIIVWGIGEAMAHDAAMGWSYPWECCHDHDCTEISADRVHTSPSGYVIDGHIVVPQSEVRQSPDGRYHACFPKPDKLRCFFAPPTGS